MRVGTGSAIAAFTGAAAVGGTLMFFLDPDRGNSRRAFVRDKSVSAATCTGRAIGKTTRDIGNRAQGIFSRTRSLTEKRDGADDETLVERVRSRIGHVVSNPGSIEVTARRGTVILHGSVPRSEMRHLILAVDSVRGVNDVKSDLRLAHEVHDRSRATDGRTPWSPTTRLIFGATGGALAAYGVTHTGKMAKALEAVGASLLTGGIADKGIPQLVRLVSRRGNS